jgi:hypothetical protein
VTGLERLLTALHEEGAAFIIIGGIAARIHGAARMTQDVDIVYARTDENIRRVVEALVQFKPYLRGAPRGLPFEWSAATIRAGLNFTLTTTAGDIDLLGEIVGGGGYEDLAPRSVPVTVFGNDTLVLDLPWLIQVKRAAGRPKDLEAIAELEVLLDLRAEE